jgi:NDP-sugar pyrophosphorylase family protein
MSLPVAILAGGLATRLKPLTDRVPKSLLDIAGKPFAVRQIELLRQHGFEEIVFCLGHMGNKVQDTLGDGSLWSLRIGYSFDGERPLGTGGALRRALPLLGDSFAVIYGDSYLECDYQEIIRAFQASGKQALMTVFRNAGEWDRSNVVFQDGEIKIYDKNSNSGEMQHIDYGLGILKASALESYPPDEPIDLATVYQQLLSENQLAGFEVGQRFFEIGSPAGLAEMRTRFLEETDTTNDLYRTSSQ